MSPRSKMSGFSFSLLALSLLLFSYGEEIGDFCACDRHHILCDSLPSNYHNRYASLHPRNDEERHVILDYLNEWRDQAARGDAEWEDKYFERGPHPVDASSNMLQLRYNKLLEKATYVHYKHCSEASQNLEEKKWCEHSCPTCTNINGIGVGLGFRQDYYYSLHDTTFAITQHLNSLINAFTTKWTVPKMLNKFALLSKTGRKDFFVFTLVAQFSEVGCTIAYNNNTLNHSIEQYGRGYIVCAFGPTTGAVGKPAFRSGPPCTECPSFSECSHQYPNLCKMKQGATNDRFLGAGDQEELCRPAIKVQTTTEAVTTSPPSTTHMDKLSSELSPTTEILSTTPQMTTNFGPISFSTPSPEQCQKRLSKDGSATQSSISTLSPEECVKRLFQVDLGENDKRDNDIPITELT